MAKLAEKKLCTGCTACLSVCSQNCISMVRDENGFNYPVIDEKECVECGLCTKVCPVAGNNPYMRSNESEICAYAAYSQKEDIRKNSSSGGVFSEFALEVLGRDGVVYGAAYNNKFEVEHICIECENELYKLRGAKYAQSELGRVFSDVKKRLKKGQQVLFSGTPCQIAGLSSFLQKDYLNLVCVDFVCLSVPSPMAWSEYIKYIKKEKLGGNMPCTINLRSKETGWSRYAYSNLFKYSETIKYTIKSSESLYMKLFGSGSISRESCASCKFKGYRRTSDLTIGDFWGIWDIAPEMDDNNGTSVILVQSSKGRDLLNSIMDNLMIKEVSLEEASKQNSAMLVAAHVSQRRNEALDLIRNGRINECEPWFKMETNNEINKVIKLWRRLLRKVKTLIRQIIL